MIAINVYTYLTLCPFRHSEITFNLANTYYFWHYPVNLKQIFYKYVNKYEYVYVFICTHANTQWLNGKHNINNDAKNKWWDIPKTSKIFKLKINQPHKSGNSKNAQTTNYYSCMRARFFVESRGVCVCAVIKAPKNEFGTRSLLCHFLAPPRRIDSAYTCWCVCLSNHTCWDVAKKNGAVHSMQSKHTAQYEPTLQYNISKNAGLPTLVIRGQIVSVGARSRCLIVAASCLEWTWRHNDGAQIETESEKSC